MSHKIEIVRYTENIKSYHNAAVLNTTNEEQLA